MEPHNYFCDKYATYPHENFTISVPTYQPSPANVESLNNLMLHNMMLHNQISTVRHPTRISNTSPTLLDNIFVNSIQYSLHPVVCNHTRHPAACSHTIHPAVFNPAVCSHKTMTSDLFPVVAHL